MTNNLWVQQNFRLDSDFTAKLSKYYNTSIGSLDFKYKSEESRKEINSYVSDFTKGNIKDILSERAISRLTRSVLVNAIYFKGSWVSEFEKETDKSEFYSKGSNGSPSLVDYIRRDDLKLLYTKTKSMKMINVPFQKDFSMDIILPKGDIVEFEKELSFNHYQEWVNSLRKTKLDYLRLPKFKQEYDLPIQEQLQDLGLKTAFMEFKADFSNMVEKPLTEDNMLHISKVFHKATIDLNEKGAEATAATAIVMDCTESATISPSMNVNKPFIYIIKNDKTNTIAFIGKVSNPSYK